MTTEKVVIGNEGMKQSKLLYSYLSYIYSNKKNEVKDKYTWLSWWIVWFEFFTMEPKRAICRNKLQKYLHVTS